MPDAPHDAPDTLAAAAILDDGTQDIDALLGELARRQRAAGRRVRGLLMTYPGTGAAEGADRSCAAAMVLVDIDTGDDYLVSQPLGAGSNACRADPQGFARASAVLRRAMGEAPDLVISNRFGGLEAEGGGFSAELLDLMAHGVPVLTAVAPRHREAWLRFTGGAPLLPASVDAVADWLAATLPAPAPR